MASRLGKGMITIVQPPPTSISYPVLDLVHVNIQNIFAKETLLFLTNLVRHVAPNVGNYAIVDAVACMFRRGQFFVSYYIVDSRLMYSISANHNLCQFLKAGLKSDHQICRTYTTPY